MRILLLIVLSLGIITTNGEKSRWMEIVDEIFKYIDIPQGIMMGFFNQMDAAQASQCFESVDDIQKFLDNIDIIDDDGVVTFKEVLQLIYDVLDFVVISIDDCGVLDTAFIQVYDEYKIIFSDLGLYWTIFFKDIAFEAMSLMGDISYITKSFQKGKFYEAGENIGEMIFDTFLKGMKEKIDENNKSDTFVTS